MVSETHNNKTSLSCNQGIAANLKGNQTDLKDTNFEYEDNEWDIGKRFNSVNVTDVLIIRMCLFRDWRFNN